MKQNGLQSDIKQPGLYEGLQEMIQTNLTVDITQLWVQKMYEQTAKVWMDTKSQNLGNPMEHYYYSPSIGCGSTRSLLRERLENST